MIRPGRAPRYQGAYWIGFVILAVVVLRVLLIFQGKPVLGTFGLLLAAYTLIYSLEPWLSQRLPWHRYLYFPVQTALAVVLANLQPFTDITSLLYIPLCVQAQQVFSPRGAAGWTLLLMGLLVTTLVFGMPGLAWLGLFVLYLAVGYFLLSYDRLYFQTLADQAKSQALLENLQAANEKLELSAAQTKELSAARERNRLARELHDSVSQVIFSITLTAQSASLLLARDPGRVPEQFDRLQEMTAGALAQLRSLIAELRPPPGR